MSMNMVFNKLERSSRTPPGWRLATVEEVRDNLESIKRDNILEDWDRVRLLDGWMGGSAYGFNVEEGFRSCLGYMLLTQTQASQKSHAEDERKADPYSEILELSKEARNDALLLCCEDCNEEVLHWLIEWKIQDHAETRAASEVVGAIAREWQSLHAKSGSPSSLEVPGIEQSLKVLVAHTEKSLRALVIKNQNSPQEEIIAKTVKKLTRESDLTQYSEMFREFGGEVVPETVWLVLVEIMTWQTFSILCSVLNYYGSAFYRYLVSHTDPFYEFLFENANGIIGEIQQDLSEGFRAAAKEANGNFKQFDEILRKKWFPLLNCKGKLDVSSIRLLWAAKKGDLNMVKELLQSGVQPSATDIGDTLMVGKWTPLHYATYNGDEKMCTLLICHNASLTARDNNGRTPLHCAMLGRDEVVRVLLSAEEEDSIEGGVGLLDVEDKDGGTLLSFAIGSCNVNMVAWMLSLSIRPESYFGELEDLSEYLRESSRMGYVDLVQKLLDDGGADPFQGDEEGKTALHYASEGEDQHVALQIIKKLLLDKKGGSPNWDKILVGDKYGRNPLHVAAFLGREELSKKLLENKRDLIESKDHDGQSPIHYAAAGPHDDTDVLNVLMNSREEATNITAKDYSQTTPLHVAAARGNLQMVTTLHGDIPAEERKNYVGAADVLGQTALHKAASGGHVEVVKFLLEEGAHPLKERDSDGKTALDFAAEAGGDKAVTIAELLLAKCKPEKQKSLLLFASAVGNGLPISSLLEDYLKKEKRKIGETLVAENSLRVAATLGDVDMIMECLTRGANIALLGDEQWRASLSKEEKSNVHDVLSKIKTIVDQGTDKPALEDNLGRSTFAIGLAALFLNPFMKSLVTVGISGEWGMGKSSIMLQTEINLLKAAAQLAFKSSFQENKLLRAEGSKLSVTGQGMRRKIANALERLDAEKGVIKIIGMSLNRLKNFMLKVYVTKCKEIEEDRNKQTAQQEGLVTDPKNCTMLVKFNDFCLKLRQFWSYLRHLWEESAPFDLPMFNDFLENKYQSKYHKIFKSLAVIDRHYLFEEKEELGSENQTVSEIALEEYSLQGRTPSILTVQYNAWHYRNETEAWAGLAVEITKELEATMTVAHKLRTSWIYNWRNRKNSICFGVILPFFLALMVAIWFSTIVWFVFDTGKHKDLKKFKYGGLPASMIVAAWGLGKLVISFVKPISSQVMDYICLPDHSQKLGYHQQVIDDIKFLKENLYYKRSLKWEVFSFIWCCITWSWDENNVPGTMIRKMPPAFGNNLRIIVFVDDLDRCEENVILQVLSAVNLVLATCEINVILSMENSMIQRAILNKYGNNNSKDDKSNEELADKYLRKIVQLPLQLPDPSDSESKDFLRRQLGMWDSIQGSTEAPGRHSKSNPKFDIEAPTPHKFTREKGRKEYFQKSVAELEKFVSSSDTHEAQQGFGETEEQEITETTEGSEVEEGTIDNHDTPAIEQPQEGSEIKEATIEIPVTTAMEEPIKTDKTERTCLVMITQMFGYVCALLCLCNVQSDKKKDDTTKGDEQDDINERDEQSDQLQRRQGNKGKRSLMDDLSSIISAMLVPKYTAGERSAFIFLHSRCTGSRKLPREWKCLMAYHRLAWNIFSLTPEVNRVEGWQVQLIAWIFVCWEWREIITILIKKWNKLAVLRNWKLDEKPSLREIVEHYIDEKWPAEQKSITKEEDVAAIESPQGVEEISDMLLEENVIEEGDDYLKKALGKVLKEQGEMREVLRKVLEEQKQNLKAQEMMMEVLQRNLKEQENTLEMIKKKVFEEEEDNVEGEESSVVHLQYKKAEKKPKNKKKQPEEWNRLRNTLRRYDVKMDAIQAFQKFRFFCQPGHLPWPLPKQD